jgi:O-antigen ligase
MHGVMSLFLLIYSRKIEWSKLHNYRLIAISWLVFLFILGFSSVFTINLPLTISAINSWLLAFMLFWFVVLQQELISTQFITTTLLLLGLVVTIISINFSLITNKASLLPGMNLIYATYGHSHLAALLILILPLSWWWVLNKNRNFTREYVGLALIVVLNLALMLSFGRVAVLIGLIQFLILVFYFIKQNNHLDSLLKRTLLFIGSFFLLTITIQIIFSFLPVMKTNFSCPIPFLKKQLCKSIGTELRPKYWYQAVMVAKEFPLVGAGLGTFGIASRKYQLIALEGTGYVHNVYLRMFAELGVVGGSVFVFLIVVLLIKATRLILKSRKKELTVQKAISIGFIGICLNVFFDFDWSFSSLLALTMILAGVVVRSGNPSPITHKRWDKFLEQLFRFVYYGISLLMLVLALTYLIVEFLIINNKVGKAFDIFPYFHWHRKIYEESPLISTQQKEELFNIYQYNPNVYQSYINSSNDKDKQQQLKERWLDLYPWNRVKQDVVSYYLEKEDLEMTSLQINKTLVVWQQIEQSKSYEISYGKKTELTQQMLDLADLLYQDGRPAEAAKWYIEARFEDEWILHKHQPIFLKHKLSPDQEIVFFTSLTEIPGEYFGQYRKDYAQGLLSVLPAMEVENGLLESSQSAEWIIELADWLVIDTWETFSKVLLTKVQSDLEQSDYIQAFKKLEIIGEIWESISNGSELLPNQEYQIQTSRYLVEVGNKLAMIEMEKTIQSYKLAQKLTPWILNERLQWFEIVDLNVVATSDLATYIDHTFNWSWDAIGWKVNERTQVFVVLIKRLIDEGDYIKALEYSSLTNQIPAITYEPRVELVTDLQLMVDDLRKNNSLEEAKVIIQIMEQLIPREDWEYLF